MNDPTQAELAALTATLATGSESTVDEFHRLAERALALWDGAGWALQVRKDRREITKRTRAGSEAAFRRAGLEPPEGGRAFKLTEALAFLMPSKRPPDQRKALRDFLTETAERDPLALPGDGADIPPGGIAMEEFTSKPTEERVSREMERLRKEGFTYGQFCLFAERLLLWLKNDAKRKKAEAGSLGGKAKPAKKKRER